MQASFAVSNAEANNGIVDCTRSLLDRHNPDLIRESDHLVCFAAYISNFDTSQKATPSGVLRFIAVPHWVIQRVDPSSEVAEGRTRPRTWFTVPDLQAKGIAPTDASYRTTEHFRLTHPNWYERGHLAQKYLAERLPGKAGWFTHNVANAVPQRGRFNKGPWLTLECYTGAWANRYGPIWIITGPIFIADHQVAWLESDSGRNIAPVAIPDGIFKIVAKKGADGAWESLAFIYPQDDPGYVKGPWNPATRLESVARIEELTHQEFFPELSATLHAQHIKHDVAGSLWPISKKDFDPSCRRFAPEGP
jgi:endonuclease G